MASEDQLNQLFGSDSEEEEAASPPLLENGSQLEKDLQLHELFGSEEEDEPAAEADRTEEEYHAQPSSSPPPMQGPPLHIEVPMLDTLDASKLWLAKLSNIVGIEAKPFDPATFEAAEAEYTDERGQKRIRVKDQTTIRWRTILDKTGKTHRQSNARFVRWSDGSLQLFLGEDVLDVKEIDITSDNNYVFARHKNIIQGQAQLLKKAVFQPATLASGFHKRLTAAVDKRHARQNRIRATTTLEDPKKLKEQREKAEEQRIRDKERLLQKQQKTMRRYGAPGPRRGLSTAFLEEEEEEDYDDHLDRARRMYDEVEEAHAERRLVDVKRGMLAENGAEEDDEGMEEMRDFIVDDEKEGSGEEEEEEPAAKRQRNAVIMDSDSD